MYRPLRFDRETEEFLKSCKPGWWAHMLARILHCCFSVTDTNGILGRTSGVVVVVVVVCVCVWGGGGVCLWPAGFVCVCVCVCERVYDCMWACERGLRQWSYQFCCAYVACVC